MKMTIKRQYLPPTSTVYVVNAKQQILAGSLEISEEEDDDSRQAREYNGWSDNLITGGSTNVWEGEW